MKKGDYVIATKYCDGSPGDHFCVGYFDHIYDHYGQTRYIIVDNDGKPFRLNGFRRAQKVGRLRGEWIIYHFSLIERMKDRFSVWHWYRATWAELRFYDNI